MVSSDADLRARHRTKELLVFHLFNYIQAGISICECIMDVEPLLNHVRPSETAALFWFQPSGHLF